MDTVFNKKSLSAEIAGLMIEAAIAKADELSVGISVTIVDESGIQKAFSRMDNAPLVSVDLSRKKAITAVGFGLNTGSQWFEFIKDDPILREGVSSIRDFSLLGGGKVIVFDSEIVGAIGVSGGHYLQDEKCALSGLEIFNSRI